MHGATPMPDDDEVRLETVPSSSRTALDVASPSRASTPVPHSSLVPFRSCSDAMAAPMRCPSPHKRRRHRLDDSDVDAALPCPRGHLRADEAGSDDDGSRAGVQRRADGEGIIERAQAMHAV